MTLFGKRVECERARGWAALAPDRELSAFEESSLRAHMAGCAACSRFAAEVGTLATTLRRQELERPSHPVTLRLPSRRRSVLAHGRSVAAAAAVALMALGVASRAPLPVDDRTSRLRAVVTETTSAGLEMRSLRERQHLLGSAPDLLVAPRSVDAPVVASTYPV